MEFLNFTTRKKVLVPVQPKKETFAVQFDGRFLSWHEHGCGPCRIDMYRVDAIISGYPGDFRRVYINGTYFSLPVSFEKLNEYWALAQKREIIPFDVGGE